ncbi:MAG: alpha/beta fold hydrolase [Actinomycetia bacterium]|nr:alpha/beta fold hydrolase [Actinomycetes bacterium]
MPKARNGSVKLVYETFGSPKDPTLLLVNGLGSQMIAWDVGMVDALVSEGFHVVRYDNRDVGLSSWLDEHQVDVVAVLEKVAAGESVEVPYDLSDMAADGIAVLDAAGVDRAHILGVSMGGMIVQTMAIEHPERVATLTSVMSRTGESKYGESTPEATKGLMEPSPPDRAGAIEHTVETGRIWASPDWYDEDRARVRAAAAYDRGFHPTGVGRQMLAVRASADRTDGLRALDVPTLVIHGTADTLIPPDGGARTAELIPGAELLLIEGMGHDYPPEVWPRWATAVRALRDRAD